MVVALTGGIASGKSAASQQFERLGVTVIDTDLIAREVVAPGSATLDAIVEQFGAQVLDSTGALDRARMRAQIFANPDQRKTLEALTHPAIMQRVQEAVERVDGAYCLIAIPLLAETGRTAWMDRVLVIDAPRSLQKRRLLERDGIDEALAEAMLAAQASREQRLALADDVIINDSTLAALQTAVAALHQRLTQRANSRAFDTDGAQAPT